MKSWLSNFCFLLVCLNTQHGLFADQVIYSANGWVVTRPDRVDCGRPPLLPVRGKGDLFDAQRQPQLNDLTIGVAASLRKLCPVLEEAVFSHGKTRRLVKLPPRAVELATPQPAVQTPRLAAPEPARTQQPGGFPPAGGAERDPAIAQEPVRTPVASPVIKAPPEPVASSPLPSIRGPRKMPNFGRERDPGKLATMVEPYCQSLIQWGEVLRKELPPNASRIQRGSPEQQRMTKIFAAVLGDDSFVPVFGKQYDKLTDTEIRTLEQEVVRPCLRRHVGMWFLPISLQSMFSTCGGYAVCVQDADFRSLVSMGRQFRNRIADYRRQMEQLKQQPDGYTQLTPLANEVAASMEFLLPSERGSLAGAVREARASAADKHLEAYLRPVLVAANGMPSRAAVQQAAAQHKGPLEDASPSVRREYQDLIATRMSAPVPSATGEATGTEAAGAFEFKFPTSLGRRIALTDERSTIFMASQHAAFRDASEIAFPEIHRVYKAAKRTVFQYGRDVDIAQFMKEMFAAGDQRVLTCRYTAQEESRTYFFWHSAVVDAGRPARLKAIERLHPLLMVGRPLEACPQDSETAVRIIRDNFRIGADYPVTKLPPPEPLLLPLYLSQMRKTWNGQTVAVQACERFAAGQPHGLPFPRRPDLSGLTEVQRGLLKLKSHNFLDLYWGELAYRDQAQYLKELREYNQAVLEVTAK